MKIMIVIFTAAFFFAAAPITAKAEPMQVFVSIEPQKWLAEQIGDHLVQTNVLVSGGKDPHSFEPSPKQLIALSASALYFRIGMEFEKLLVHKISRTAAGVNFVNTSLGIDKIPMASFRHDTHQDHSGLDPHIWLSPLNLKIMAKTMTKAMIQADPGNKATYETNLYKTISTLDRLHKKISAQLALFHGRTFYVFHPSFGYFARDYHLQQKAVEVEGKTPTPKQLSHLIEMAKADNVQVIFVQPQFDPNSADAVAKAIGGQVVPLNPLAENVAGNLQTIADKIAAALK